MPFESTLISVPDLISPNREDVATTVLSILLSDKDFKLLSELFGVSGAFFTIFILHEPLLFEADSPDAVATSALATFTYALPKAIVLNL